MAQRADMKTTDSWRPIRLSLRVVRIRHSVTNAKVALTSAAVVAPLLFARVSGHVATPAVQLRTRRVYITVVTFDVQKSYELGVEEFERGEVRCDVIAQLRRTVHILEFERRVPYRRVIPVEQGTYAVELVPHLNCPLLLLEKQSTCDQNVEFGRNWRPQPEGVGADTLGDDGFGAAHAHVERTCNFTQLECLERHRRSNQPVPVAVQHRTHVTCDGLTCE